VAAMDGLVFKLKADLKQSEQTERTKKEKEESR